MYLVYTALLLLAGAAIWAAIAWYRNRKSETDPIKLLARQAAKMRWKKAAEITEEGLGASWARRSARFVRDKEEAVLWHKDATITLVRDYAPPTFDNFIEVERWIKKNPKNPELDIATGERLYQREIERFVTRHGYFAPLLEATASDKALFVAVHSFHKAGYVAQADPVVVAALTLDALTRYQKDRNAALGFLSGLEKDIAAATSKSQAEQKIAISYSCCTPLNGQT